MPQILCRDLTAGYPGHPVFTGLNFDVNAGDYFCIVGENGAGKSTLMKTLLGLQKPLAGRVELGDGLTRRDMGYLSQQTPVQRDFPASVREVVLSGFQGRMGLRPFYNRSEKEAARENMARLGIEELAGRCYRDLSGGQQQRVLLARALGAARKLLLLDEPVAGLDPLVTEDMYRILQELHQSGLTILMITHDVSEALPFATRVLHIGRRLFSGSRTEYQAWQASFAVPAGKAG